MYVCKIENALGEQIILNQNENNYQILSIEGLNPPNAQINMTAIAGMDGAKFNSSKIEVRNIVIQIKINGEIEANRIKLYRFFQSKKNCVFYFKNETRDVYIDCFCESVEVSPFSQNEIMQISLVCPSSYFKAMEEVIIDIRKVTDLFQFPFSINENNPIPISSVDNNRIINVYNDSETEVGMIIQVDVLNSFNRLEIVNSDTGERFIIVRNFIESDSIFIDTFKGEKSVYMIRDAVKTNIFSSIVRGSTFFQLAIGDNHFGYLIDNDPDNSSADISYRTRTIYGGV